MLFHLAFPAIGFAVAAVVVWQIVRSINRRPNRKAIARAAAVTALLVLYVVSFGPAYWWQRSSRSRIIPIIYAPLVEGAWHSPGFVLDGLRWYACCIGYDSDEPLGCHPLWRDGPRAFDWYSMHVLEPAPVPPRNVAPESK